MPHPTDKEFIYGYEAGLKAAGQPVAINAGQVAYDDSASYTDGTVGGEIHDLNECCEEAQTDIANLKSQISEVEASFPQKSASGSIVTIEDGADNVPLVSLTAEIVPVQSGSGDPAPDNVRPISGWTGANIPVTGINIYDENDTEQGRINLNTGADNPTGNGIRSKTIKPIKPNTTYRAIRGSAAGALAICYYDQAGTFLSYAVLSGGNFTTPATAFGFRLNLQTSDPIVNPHDISINYPSSDTTYHAYTGRTVNISWETEAGTVYGGTLVLNQDGTADLVRTRGFDTIDGVNKVVTSVGSYAAGVYAYTVASQLSEFALSTSGKGASISNLFKAGGTSDYNVLGYCYATGPSVVFTMGEEMTVEEVNAWLAENPLQISYTLATPVTYHIENVELVKTLYGFNNLWCDTGDIDLTYRCDPATYTAEQIRIMLNAMVATVEASTTASKAYNVNDFLILDNVLYKVIANIASGGTITINTNVSATTIGEQITNILNS